MSFGGLVTISSWDSFKKHINNKDGIFSEDYEPLSVEKVQEAVDFLGEHSDQVSIVLFAFNCWRLSK
jgi:hypothetical protein